MKSSEVWRREAVERGRAAGEGLSDSAATDILAALFRGEDVWPRPLSGECAGESIPEVFGLAPGEPYPFADEMDTYETLYMDAWRAGVDWAAGII